MKSVIILLGAAMLTLTGCSKYKEIRPTSFKLESVSVHGLRSVDLEVSVGVNNPAGQLAISDFSGEVEHSGKVLGKVAVDPFTLQGKTADTYRIDAGLALAEGVSVLELGRLLDKKELDKVTVDVSADVQIRKGKARTIKVNDLPLEKLIDAVK